MLSAFREMQLPLLAALLVLACAGKAARAARSRSIAAGTGPTTMFPLHLRRPAAIAMCAIELALGLALIATAGRPIAWPPPAVGVRLRRGLLFATPTAAPVALEAPPPAPGRGRFRAPRHTPRRL